MARVLLALLIAFAPSLGFAATTMQCPASSTTHQSADALPTSHGNCGHGVGHLGHSKCTDCMTPCSVGLPALPPVAADYPLPHLAGVAVFAETDSAATPRVADLLSCRGPPHAV